jgi:hypothetical protein
MKNEFLNKTIYNRDEHESFYTCITNKMKLDKNLNYFDYGMMYAILSNSDDYIINATVLLKECGFGKTVFYTSFHKLQKLGYINKKVLGQGSGVLWTINEIVDNSISENRISNNGNPNIRISESRIPIFDPLISTNETSNKEINIKEENTNGPILDHKEIFSEVEEFTFGSKMPVAVETIPVKTLKEFRDDFNEIFPNYFNNNWEEKLMKKGIDTFFNEMVKIMDQNLDLPYYDNEQIELMKTDVKIFLSL